MTWNLVVFILTITFIILPLSALLSKKARKDSSLIILRIVPVLTFQFIVFIVGSLLNANYLMAIPARLYIILLLFSIIILLLLLYLFYVIFIDVTRISIDKKWNKLKVKSKIMYLLFVIILLIIVPHLLFSLVYMMAYGIYDIKQLLGNDTNYFDFFYLSFATYFSLPLKDESSLSNIQILFSVKRWLRIIQVVHIIISKLMEFILIGYFVSRATDVIMSLSNRKANKNHPLIAKELKELHQLKVNGIITQKEFDDKKKVLLEN